MMQARCCIAGGGPAGMMLGFLLARAGVETVVLEKHADFLRDFRGDTIHASTLEMMYELGLLEEFLQRPHQEVHKLGLEIGGEELTVADFSHLPTHCKFIGLMPQWDFLNFLVEQAKRYSAFHLIMKGEATGLIQENGRVTGLRVKTPAGELEVRADLVVAADGRHSVLRQRAGLEIMDLGAPMDVLWMRISKQPDDPPQTLFRIDAGKILIMIDRGDYWQCAYIIPKGAFDEIRAKGLEPFRANLAEMAPFVKGRLEELSKWEDISLLTVVVDRLKEWYRPGFLCIGDAAHAMSPIGGVGINLAIQDAVAAANILARPLLDGAATTNHLSGVQRRRELPTRLTQRAQVFVQDNVVRNVLKGGGHRTGLPFPLKLVRQFPILRRIPARLIGIGFRPEHVSAAVVK